MFSRAGWPVQWCITSSLAWYFMVLDVSMKVGNTWIISEFYPCSFVCKGGNRDFFTRRAESRSIQPWTVPGHLQASERQQVEDVQLWAFPGLGWPWSWPQTRIKTNFLNLINSIYKTLTVNTTWNGERLGLSPESRTGQGHWLSPVLMVLLNVALKVPDEMLKPLEERTEINLCALALGNDSLTRHQKHKSWKKK